MHIRNRSCTSPPEVLCTFSFFLSNKCPNVVVDTLDWSSNRESFMPIHAVEELQLWVTCCPQERFLSSLHFVTSQVRFQPGTVVACHTLLYLTMFILIKKTPGPCISLNSMLSLKLFFFFFLQYSGSASLDFRNVALSWKDVNLSEKFKLSANQPIGGTRVTRHLG